MGTLPKPRCTVGEKGVATEDGESLVGKRETLVIIDQYLWVWTVKTRICLWIRPNFIQHADILPYFWIKKLIKTDDKHGTYESEKFIDWHKQMNFQDNFQLKIILFFILPNVSCDWKNKWSKLKFAKLHNTFKGSRLIQFLGQSTLLQGERIHKYASRNIYSIHKKLDKQTKYAQLSILRNGGNTA